jgi:hypothetical protein
MCRIPLSRPAGALPMKLPAGSGRDAFHCVPNCRPEDGEAVARVPPRFRGSKRELVRPIFTPFDGEKISRAQVRALNPRTGARLCRRPAAASGPALRLAFSTVALRFMGRAGLRAISEKPANRRCPLPERGRRLTSVPTMRMKQPDKVVARGGCLPRYARRAGPRPSGPFVTCLLRILRRAAAAV